MNVDGVNKLERLEELEGEEYREIMTFLEEALFEGLRQEGDIRFICLIILLILLRHDREAAVG